MVAASGVTDCIEVECSEQPLDFSFHPTKLNLFAAALVDGTVEVHDYQELIDCNQYAAAASAASYNDDDEIDTILTSTAVHTQLLPSKTSDDGAKHATCRAILFSTSTPTVLYTGGTAGDLFALDAERLCTFSSTQSSLKKCTLWNIPFASKAPIHILYELTTSLSGALPLLVTGDDSGGVRLWDSRLCGNHTTTSGCTARSISNNPIGCVMSWKKHTDYISGFDQSSVDTDRLLACSADGRLSVYDLRMSTIGNQNQKDQYVRLSDEQDDELLSIKVMKHGKKVVCGTTDGVLNIWSYGTWGDISDRFPGHPKSIDALLKWDEDTLLTGSSDGMIRVVTIHPDKLIGLLGDNHDGYPIEKLQYNCNRTYVGSVTHDNVVRLWGTKILTDEDSDDDENVNVEHQKQKALSSTLKKVQASTSMKRNSDEEWEDMDGTDDDVDMEHDDDDESDDDDDDKKPRSKSDKISGRFKTANERFFGDL